LIIAFFTPNFDDYLNYYLFFGPRPTALKEGLVFFGVLFLTFMYELKFIDSEAKALISAAMVFKLMSSLVNLMVALIYKDN